MSFSQVPKPEFSGNKQLTIMTAYHCRGISRSPNSNSLILDNGSGSSAFLTDEPTIFWQHYDRICSLAATLLNGLLGNKGGLTPKERFLAQLADCRAERTRKYPNGAFLVTKKIILTPCSFELPLILGDEFYFTIDAYNKKDHKKIMGEFSSPFLLATQLTAPDNITADLSEVGIVSFLTHPDDQHPIYSFHLEGGTAGVSLARPAEENRVAEIAATVNKIERDPKSKNYLFVFSSISTSNNPTVQQAIILWSSFEMLVNDLHARFYLKQWTAHMMSGVTVRLPAYEQELYNSLKRHHSLLDKFMVVSSILSLCDVDNDLDLFRHLKSQRDNFYHTGEHFEFSYFCDKVKYLFQKYLHKHLNHGSIDINR